LPKAPLQYECPQQDVVVRVLLQRRNGTKKCPIALLHQGDMILATDSNLRDLRDVEALQKHAGVLRQGPNWHEILTAVAAALPEHAATVWEPISRPLSQYAVERKTYLWYPSLPQGEPVSLEGDPGSGKSATLIKLLCHLTSGQRFPTLFPDRPEQDCPPRTVMLFTYEDDPHSTIRPRVELNGGDPARVEIIEGKKDPETGDVLPMTLQDLGELEALLKTHTPALMAFDPIQSFFGVHVDMNRASDTRPLLDAVRNLCKRYGCTPLYVRHHGKAQRSKAMHTALGSIDITGNMRSVLALYKDPNDDQRRILAQTKTNGRLAPSMQLRLVGATYETYTDPLTIETIEEVRVDWDGKSDLTAEDLNAREGAHGNDTHEAQSALDQAREFLREVLTDGPLSVEELLAAAKQAGIKRRTLDRAKDKEGVKARRVPTPDTPSNKWPWEWHYPTIGGHRS